MLETTFLHVKIDVQNLDRSLAFYCGALGWKPIVRYDRPDHVIIVQISPTGEPPGIELWYEEPYRGFHNDRLHLAFGVKDVRALVRQLEQHGMPIEREPFQIGHEVIAFIRDPDGYRIELNEDTSQALMGSDVHPNVSTVVSSRKSLKSLTHH